VVTWLLNETGGKASEAVGSPEAAWHINATGDFNGDGRDDILWRHDDGTVVTWLLDGQGGHLSRTLASPDSGWQVEDAGGYNGDGVGDVLWRNRRHGGGLAPGRRPRLCVDHVRRPGSILARPERSHRTGVSRQTFKKSPRRLKAG
jgi:hypothetical protein